MRPELTSAAILQVMRSVMLGSYLDERPGPPPEKCGLLLGRAERLTRLEWTDNVSETPQTAFEIDPAQLISAIKRSRRSGALEVMGYYHTHLSGEPWPSPRDAACAAPDGKLWLIVTTMQARLWRAVEHGSVEGRFDPVRFDLRIGKNVSENLLEVRHVDYGREYMITMEPPF